jgi:hypothetical protein
MDLGAKIGLEPVVDVMGQSASESDCGAHVLVIANFIPKRPDRFVITVF